MGHRLRAALGRVGAPHDRPPEDPLGRRVADRHRTSVGGRGERRLRPRPVVVSKGPRMKALLERFREGTVGVLLLSALAGGLALDLGSDGVDPGRGTPVEGPRFEERALFCPPAAGGKTVTGRLTVASESGDELDVEVSPQLTEPLSLEGGHTRTVDVVDPTNVVGRGGAAFASAMSAFSEPVAGRGAAPCSRTASSRWYFGEGSSILGFDERLLVYNPFPDEAVVAVSFLTPAGTREPANLSDVGVPAGGR